MKKDFNDFRFNGLEYKTFSNKYYTMNRVSKDKNKIVVKVSSSHLIKTKYGYALILDKTHVVFLKEWQVDINYFGNEVLLNKKYFIVKKWGLHENFTNEDEPLNFEYWSKISIKQDNLKDENGFKITPVKWLKKIK